MDDEEVQKIAAAAALAAGIVQARGAKTVAEIREAFRDARYITSPTYSGEPGYKAYQEWKTKHGVE